MSSPPGSAEIVKDARWLAQAVDVSSALLRLVDMSPADYRAESFLDDRLLQRPHKSVVVPWNEVAAAVSDDARRDARWIFHIGHVGSTLASRLLGELGNVLALREPRLLRDLAMAPEAQLEPFLDATRALMSRTFAEEQVALVKATSMVSEIAHRLVPSDGRTLFLYASPRAYMATILAGENSVRELEMLAPLRAQRMAGRVPMMPDSSSSQAHAAAAAWACEMTALESSADAMSSGSVMWTDFDAMLADPEAWLAEAAAFFGFDAPADRVQAIATGALMRRYSKALEYDYSPELRRELLDEAAVANRAAMDSAMVMLQTAASRSPLLARALARSQPET